jgi:leucyl aminopeptidase (aminopeptidase T)
MYIYHDPRGGPVKVFYSKEDYDKYAKLVKEIIDAPNERARATLEESRRQFDATIGLQRTQYEGGRRDKAAALNMSTATIRTGYQEMLDAWSKSTGQAASDIRSSYNDQQAGAMQHLAATGMANTTIAPTLKLGYEREAQAALNRQHDADLQQKIGILGQRTNALANQQGQLGIDTGYTGWKD